MAPDRAEGEERNPGIKPSAVSINALTKVLGRKLTVLDSVNLTVEQGDLFGIVGPNGAGKSTLFKVLLGLARPTAGRVEIFGRAVGPGAEVLAEVGAMVDGPGFLPYLSGRKNLDLIQRANRRGMSTADLQWALDESGLGAALGRPYRTYSHGMRYRLGLAAAMMGRPSLLLLDEPTTGLDPAHTSEVEDLLKQQVDAGATVLLASHDLGFIERLCSHAAFLVDGRILRSASVAELIDDGGSIRAAYLDAAEKTRDPAESRASER